MRQKVLIGFFVAVFIFSVTMIIVENTSVGFEITGHAITTSNVTITEFFAIDLSDNLDDGIEFGTVNTLPADDQTATNNADSGDGNTTMYVNVSEDSNTAIDVCIKANADLSDPSNSNVIGIGNETYANSTTTVDGAPDLADEVSLTTDYVLAGEGVSIGGLNYYKLWLDVPVATAVGSYNNTIEFKGVVTTAGC